MRTYTSTASMNTESGGKSRSYVVTGSASGIGKATTTLLEGQGARVVGVDVRDAEIVADLSTPVGRITLVERVSKILGDTIDAVISCAGIAGLSLAPEQIVRVNYFGAVATLSELRPLLARGDFPRAAVIASIGILGNVDEALVDACLAGDEDDAVRYSRSAKQRPYPSTKRAVARWIRRNATSSDWAGAGIALNAVAPGIIETPQTTHLLGTPALRAETMKNVPQPFGGIGAPEYVASLLAWLTSPDNRFVTGQVVFIDGGYDAVTRGDDIW
jgi:NAD(P)-dependent dehydrogenase (short-subunit alcohol dehydrogenase family)